MKEFATSKVPKLPIFQTDKVTKVKNAKHSRSAYEFPPMPPAQATLNSARPSKETAQLNMQ